MTIREVVAELGGHAVEALAVPGKLRTPVGRAVIWDAQAADDVTPGDLILAVGMSDRSAQFTTLLDHASSCRAAGVVIMAPIRGDWVRFAAERSGLAVLVAPQTMPWDWLYTVVRTQPGCRPPRIPAGSSAPFPFSARTR